MDSELAWYVARASGIVAWALAAVSVLGGFALSGRFFGRQMVPPAWLADLHRALGGLAVVFTGVHVAALVADSYVQFDVVDILVPFASQWRPVAVAYGVVALYLLVAVELTSLLRRRLSNIWWRRMHLSSVPLFAFGTLHFFTAGTDADHPLAIWLVVGAAALFVLLAVFRVLNRPPRTSGSRRQHAGHVRRTGSDAGRKTAPASIARPGDRRVGQDAREKATLWASST